MSNYTASSPTLESGEGDYITVYGDRWEAKQKIERLFEKGKTLWYSDIAELLGLDLGLVVDICKELELEGKIKGEEDVK